MVTGVGSVINTADAKAGQFIGVVGLGGVGLSAVLASLALGAGKVIAIDLSEEKLEFAKNLEFTILSMQLTGRLIKSQNY